MTGDEETWRLESSGNERKGKNKRKGNGNRRLNCEEKD